MSRRRDEEVPQPRKSRAGPSIEKLIEQRRLIEDWLAKLDDGADGMPSHVIARVRNDYTARLASLTQELGEHSDDVRQRLVLAEERRGELEKEQTARKDELAELKLRRTVGELDEGRFKDQQRKLKDTIEDLARELGETLTQIEKLEEILDTLNEEEEEEEQEEQEEAPPPKAAAKAAPPPAPKQPAAPAAPAKGDELSFLRSVTTTMKPATPVPPPAPAAPPAAPLQAAPAAPVKPVPPPPKPKPPEEEYELEQQHDPTKPRERPSRIERVMPEGEKTLTCRECGAKNLPTEWYCEKCGAELADI